MLRHATAPHPAGTSVTAAPRSGGGHGILRLAAIALLIVGIAVVYDAAPAAHAETTTVNDAATLIAAFTAGGNVALGADITVTPDDGALIVGAGKAVELDLNGHDLTATGGDFHAGIDVPQDTALTIADSAGTGSLTATGGKGRAGIGNGTYSGGCGQVTITSGVITATGGTNWESSNTSGAGIGGSYGAICTQITINGGTVTATGGFNGAGIGGGGNNVGPTVTINGGTVTVTGGFNGAGIGGGANQSGGTITINGGTIVAQNVGGEASGGAGIGGGFSGSNDTVHITGGTITALGGEQGAGIGGGTNGDGGTVTIDGATVTAIGGHNSSFGGAGIGGGYHLSSTHTPDGPTLTIGSDATVTVGGKSRVAVGGTKSFGTITNNGTLVLSNAKWNTIVIPEGGTLTNNGTIKGSGAIEGLGGVLANNGTVVPGTVTIDSDLPVTGHHYSLFFDANGATVGSAPSAIFAYSTTLGIALPDGSGLLQNRCPFGGWHLDPDGTGDALSTSTDLSVGDTVVSTDGNPVAVTAYAGFDCTTPVEPTVTFDPQGGSPIADQTVTEGDTATEPAEPTRDGYAFDGWYTEATGGTAWDFDTDLVTDDLTLHAHWTEIYTITFDSQGGSPIADETVTEGDTATEPAEPTRDGYAFDGWYTEAAGGTAWDFDTDLITDDLTLHAHWTEIYTITFDSQGGSPIADRSAVYNNPVEPPEPPTRDGYAFAGWHTAVTGGTQWDFDADLVTEDLTLYAHWTELPGYWVTFHASGSPTVTQFVPEGATVVKPADPIDPGYVFVGWHPYGDVSDWDFATVPTSDMRLDATWTLGTYTVTFDAQGGSPVPPPVDVVYFLSTTPEPADPTRAGYTFDHWWTEPTGGMRFSFVGWVTSDRTAYAHWIVDSTSPATEHTATFDSQGGSAIADQAITDGDTVTKPTDPTRPGYTFDGWYTTATGGSPWSFATAITAATTLYAHWTEKPSTPTSTPTSAPTSTPTSTSTISRSTSAAAPTTTSPAPSSTASATPSPAPTASTPVTAGESESGIPVVTTLSSSIPPSHAPLPSDSDTGTPGFHLDTPAPTSGSPITLTADGFLPGSVVDFWLNSDPVYLGSAVADARGIATLTVTLDAATPGRHHLQALGTATDGAPRNLAQPITIAPVPAALASTGLNSEQNVGLALLLLLSGAALLGVDRRLRARAHSNRE